MTLSALLSLACHVLHIGATCTSLGGLFYARMVLWPTVNLLPQPERERALTEAIRRFAVIKWTGVVIIAITGMIQWMITYPRIADQAQYLVYFMIKMAGALGLFSITFLLAVPAERLKGMQRHRAFWSGVNIACGLTILTGAALMHAAARR